MRSIKHAAAPSPLASGYVLTYRPGYINFCPGCSRSHWHIGRHTAECAFCMTALPIAVLAEGWEPLKTTRNRWRALLGAA